MSDPLREALSAVERGKAIVRSLTQSRRESDVNQCVGGLATEFTIIDAAVRQALGAALSAAVGDRPGLVASDAPATSRATARGITVKTGTQRGRILLAIHNHSGLTDYEIHDTTDIKPDTLRPRRVELVDAGLVLPVSDRTRKHGGTDWTVWTCTPLGHETARELIRLGIRGSVLIDPQQCVEASLDEPTGDPQEGEPVLF
jgi:hypothetical protein